MDSDMGEYRVVFARSAARELRALNAVIAARILERIEALTRDARPSGCRKIRGSAGLYRIRVGEYRIVYEVDDGEKLVDVMAVRHRQDAY